MPLMISRIGHARGRPVFFAAGRWGAITHHSLSVTSVWYRFVSRICCIRVVGIHMVSPGLVSATPLESRRCQPLNLFRNGLSVGARAWQESAEPEYIGSRKAP